MKDKKYYDSIDESDIETPSASDFEPTLSEAIIKIKREKIKAWSSLSKLFIILSFGLFGLLALIAVFNADFSLKAFDILLDKVAAVYLVIFGYELGKGLK